MAINSGRIAKNTLFLYARLLLVMGVTLYASRVILEVLGETDYGLYYAIFSVIGLLSFLNGTLSAGTSRFITFELGRGDLATLRTTFSTALVAHLLLAGVILVLGETVGLWYAAHVLVVPPGSETAAMAVYQISVLSTVVAIIQVPFTAEIIAHERMNVYAYLGIYEAVARLAVVFLLVNGNFDKLILFAVLQACVVVSVFVFYVCYSHRSFKEVRFSIDFDKSVFRSMMGFSGWNIIANLSETLMSQGVIMLYNVFFLPVVVAAQAVANQISNALMQFVNNVRQAMNPQIIKLYADGSRRESQKLTYASAEYIFYLLLMLGVPCIMVMPRILSIWLVEVPEYTVAFARLIIAQQILGNFSAAFYTPMLAANKIAKNSVAAVFLCIFQFVALWILFKIGFGPLWARYLGLLSSVLFSFAVKPYILWKDIDYDIKEMMGCILKCMATLAVVVAINTLLYWLIPQRSLSDSLCVLMLSLVVVSLVCWMSVGKAQRAYLTGMVKNKLKRK